MSHDVFSKSFTEHFLKHVISRKVILGLDGRTAQCSLPFLLQTAVENNVYHASSLSLYSHLTA
jgi:hypothetical protein